MNKQNLFDVDDDDDEDDGYIQNDEDAKLEIKDFHPNNNNINK